MTKSDEGLIQSIKQRLMNYTRGRGEVFNLVLVRYAVERLLYRLTRSPYADAFVLKGAMLFSVWADKPHRATQDVDLLGLGDPSADRLAQIFREVCNTDVPADGLVFDADTIRVEPIREEALYDGLRVVLLAMLGRARVPVQVDVGFGDAITPGPTEMVFGPILDLPPPRLRAYPPETVVAEKLDAVIARGLTNSRMKDYFDLWTLARTMPFTMATLSAAVKATAQRRGTPWPDPMPIGLSDEFALDGAKREQWKAFLRKMAGSEAKPPLEDVVREVRVFLLPVLEAAVAGHHPNQTWLPGGPWENPG